MTVPELRVRPLVGLPEVREGARIGELVAALGRPSGDEVVVISQKIVSKAEGRLRRLEDVTPSGRARELAEATGKDQALVELVLAESRSVVRAEPGVLITETNAGWVCANAGIDSSNLPGEGWVALLPEDADASARRIRAELRDASDASPAVVIADSFGRPWRLGQAEVALGCAGLAPLDDWRGRPDAHGRTLAATRIAVADQAAAAADLVRDKDSAVPGAILSGLGRFVTDDDGPGSKAQQRPADQDLFR
ncbi:MAG TPA: coenzyme F420-0:L-glutamate ligase [Solirubrobacterales bacterium]|nr:coenzyme F420-0:L-glutamate ligase [Solirubrobacterales bacterium]